MKEIDETQFGTVPKSSTTQALISMVHEWTKHTDGNGSTVRVLFDFSKAFDLIDHSILAEKLTKLNLPCGILCWIIDFLKSRKQRVKLGSDCKSEWRNIRAGVPQGTKLGPWLFVLMINDIGITDNDLWKYVDDSTIAEPLHKWQTSKIQSAVDELAEMSHRNKFQINEAKCKELRISFAKCKPQFEPIVIDDKLIKVVTRVKLLRLNISNDLKWNCHISEIVKKVVTQLYYPGQLKRTHVAEKDLATFHITCIRPITEYACPVFHNELPSYLSDDLERIQKRALRIIFHQSSYVEALELCSLPSLYDRRESLTTKLFEEICCDTNHKLHHLLPEFNRSSVDLRKTRKFNVPRCETNRLNNSFIYYNSSKMIF